MKIALSILVVAIFVAATVFLYRGFHNDRGLVVATNIPTEHRSRFPDIVSLQVIDDKAVIFYAENVGIDHIPEGSGGLASGYINAKTGREVNGVTVRVGEICIVGMMNVVTQYKLLSIHDGICTFEQSYQDNFGLKSHSIVVIAPYPPDP